MDEIQANLKTKGEAICLRLAEWESRIQEGIKAMGAAKTEEEKTAARTAVEKLVVEGDALEAELAQHQLQVIDFLNNSIFKALLTKALA